MEDATPVLGTIETGLIPLRAAATPAEPRCFDPQHAVVASLDDHPEVINHSEVSHYFCDRTSFENAVAEVLELGPTRGSSADSGARGRALVMIAGDWCSARCVDGLMAHLDADQNYADDELICAFTRLGPAAVPPLIHALFDHRLTPRARRRAVHALASVGVAAVEYGDDADWLGCADRHYLEVCTCLHALLCRHAAEESSVVREIAQRLCDLRYEPAWPMIRDLFSVGILRTTDDFGRHSAYDLMRGLRFDYSLGRFLETMLDW